MPSEQAHHIVREAGVDAVRWPDALHLATEAAGAHACQMLGFCQDRIVLNIADGFSQDVLIDFERNRGGDPLINPRVRPSLLAAPGQTVAEVDFIAADARRRDPFYQDFLRKYDSDFSCMVKFDCGPDLSVVLSIHRSERQGHIGETERRRLQKLTPEFQAAATLQLDTELRAAMVAAHALEALHLAAMICDPTGRIAAMSPAAECVLRAGDPLRLDKGRIASAHPEESKRLRAAVACSPAARMSAPAGLRTLILRGRNAKPVRVDVVSLSTTLMPLGARAASLIVVREPRPVVGAPLMALGLTPAEVAIVERLYDGYAPSDVAEQRGVSTATVRSQIKSIYSKLNVSRHGEFITLVRKII